MSFRDSYRIDLEPVDTAGNADVAESDAVDIEDADSATALDAADTKFDPRLAVVSIVVIDAIEGL